MSIDNIIHFIIIYTLFFYDFYEYWNIFKLISFLIKIFFFKYWLLKVLCHMCNFKL